jgi:hypothetical protein
MDHSFGIVAPQESSARMRLIGQLKANSIAESNRMLRLWFRQLGLDQPDQPAVSPFNFVPPDELWLLIPDGIHDRNKNRRRGRPKSQLQHLLLVFLPTPTNRDH